jgi:hypothetical protein
MINCALFVLLLEEEFLACWVRADSARSNSDKRWSDELFYP